MLITSVVMKHIHTYKACKGHHYGGDDEMFFMFKRRASLIFQEKNVNLNWEANP